MDFYVDGVDGLGSMWTCVAFFSCLLFKTMNVCFVDAFALVSMSAILCWSVMREVLFSTWVIMWI